jgi:hypothetical protein
MYLRRYFCLPNIGKHWPASIRLGAAPRLLCSSSIHFHRKFVSALHRKHTRPLIEPSNVIYCSLSGSLILRTSTTSCGYMHSFSICSSHSLCPGSISCDTHLIRPHPFFRLIRQDSVRAIHGSRHMFTLVPGPIRPMIPCLTRFRPCSTALHVGDESAVNTVLMSSPLG